ncbi:hypothetical protein DACRYDRAFT_117889 [Dacryopinax primogenitus]|uniref:F-box domain-containing protein n=1 Tax=Dacryopinax primogenitus (strain DJM 731) TaxID=1858805 RepID=M5G1J9_DACPD|nr:uncharacterized protein DACRYDRAFT_117889 [Dacryopinax primogenitus]EJT99706.1 hypothetical protein DACRYDRAFT_117889 [Dacryopinax primogenitus]
MTVELPYDIWVEVVCHVEDQCDLIHFCRTNSMLSQLTTRRLYTSVFFDNIVEIAKFYRTVGGNDLLAAHVIALQLDLQRYASFVNISSYRRHGCLRAPSYLRLIFRLIGNLPNLKELKFGSHLTDELMSQSFSINLGQMRPRLTNFTFTRLLECSALPVLRSQSSLESLCLHYFTATNSVVELADLSSDAIPRLRRFICDSPSSIPLVRGRPVEEFCLMGNGPFTAINPGHLSFYLAHLRNASSRCLQKLELSIQPIDSTVLPQIEHALPDIMELSISTREPVQWVLPALTSSRTLDAFRGFTQLHTFKFYATNTGALTRNDLHAAMDPICDACDTLKMIEIQETGAYKNFFAL